MKPTLVALYLLASGALCAQQYVISTIAGGGPPPTQFPVARGGVSYPYGLATGAPGSLYYSTTFPCLCAYKVDQSGTVTRIAGNGRQGHSGDGGPGIAAELSDTGRLAVDGAGNLYLADADRVRRVSPSGIITTVAGGGTVRYGGGPTEGVPATSVYLAIPIVYYGGGIAVDGSGNLFIAASGGVRKVSPSGIITTFAPSLGGAEPLTVDRFGNLFCGEGSKVVKVSPDGAITTVAGNGTPGFSGDGGPATSAQLDIVFGLAVDGSGNLFIADTTRVRKVSPSGIITTVAGGGSANPNNGGPATSAQLAYNIMDVAVDGEGNLFIADVFGLYKVTADGIIAGVTGNGDSDDCCFSGDGGPAVSAELFYPSDVSVDDTGDVFIADNGNSRVRKVSPTGVITTVAGDGSPCVSDNVNNCGPAVDGIPATAAHLLGPWGVSVDVAGNLFIADIGAGLVRKVSPNGIITTVAGGGSSGDGGPATSARLYPYRVAVDAAGSLFITDASSIRKVSANGTISTVAGNGMENFSGDGGPAASAELDPDDSCGEGLGGGLALDGAGDLLIADTYNNAVREISSNGRINTVAGVGHNSFPGDGFSGDGGPATSAHLNLPWGVAFDGAGSFFVADLANNRIRKISPSGIITTVAGNGLSGYGGDGGPATSAALGRLGGIAGDGAGDIYFIDGNSVRVLRPTNHSVFVEAVVDAASQSANPVSPGKIVVIYGAGLGAAQLVQNQPANGQFGTQIGGTTVAFNGVAAPILYASATQVAAIVPYAVTGMSAQVTVSYQGETSTSFTVPMALAAPGIFTLTETGAGQAAALNSDGTVNTATNPVKIGGFISLYSTGEGQTSPPGVDGKLGGSTPMQPVLPVSATVGGIPATIQYKGSISGQVAGLMQVNVQIPSGVQPGGYVPVVLQVGDVSTTPGAVWIAVSGN